MNYMSATPCPVCRGKRLRPESLAVKIGGLSIADFTDLPLNRALSAAINLSFTAREALVAERIRREIVERLEFLCAVGLNYLSLARNAATLSGGEGQRIRLATQIGSRLRGVLYVLDEPSIGLHQRDNNRLIHALEQLRDLGNTVLVVEHDEETIRHADYVVDLGPGAGRLGGHVVAEGTPDQIMACPQSLTGRYLSGEAGILHRTAPRPLTGKWLTVQRRARAQPAGHRHSHPAGRHDSGDRRQRQRQKHPDQRHSLPLAGPRPLRLARGSRRARSARPAPTSSTRSFASTSRPSGARRDPTRPPTPAFSRPSAICSPCCPSRANAATSRDASAST